MSQSDKSADANPHETPLKPFMVHMKIVAAVALLSALAGLDSLYKRLRKSIHRD